MISPDEQKRVLLDWVTDRVLSVIGLETSSGMLESLIPMKFYVGPANRAWQVISDVQRSKTIDKVINSLINSGKVIVVNERRFGGSVDRLLAQGNILDELASTVDR